MKKLLAAAILCTALLCGCSGKGTAEISETAETVTVGETVTTTSVTQTETTAATKAATAAKAETTVTEKTTVLKKAVTERIILTPIPSEEPLDIITCSITDDIMMTDENDFPDKEALKLAREVCFADEEIHKQIEENNSHTEDFYLPEEVEAYKIKNADDLLFNGGCAFDFDLDGEDECLIGLGYTQTAMGGIMGGNALLYVDGGECEILEDYTGRGTFARVINAGEYVFLLSSWGAGASYYCYDIYRFESGMPEKVIDCGGEAKSIEYKNGIFYCEIKFYKAYPFVLCGDGVFRQLGREKITREDFENHVQNGGAYLDSLADEGDEITEIYTYGYFEYELWGEDFSYGVYGDYDYIYDYSEREFLTQRYNGIPSERRFTDEVVYGDVWAVQTVD